MIKREREREREREGEGDAASARAPIGERKDAAAAPRLTTAASAATCPLVPARALSPSFGPLRSWHAGTFFLRGEDVRRFVRGMGGRSIELLLVGPDTEWWG